MRSRLLLVATLVVLFALALGVPAYAWRAEIGGIDSLPALLQALEQGAYGPAVPLLVTLVYVVAGFVFFPVTLLIALTGIAFGPVAGAGYALTGAVASGVAAYAVGHLLSRDVLQRYAGARLQGLRRQLKARGFLAVVVVRIVPSGPFTLMNLVAGASGIRFRDFFWGTVIGMAPGILVTVGLVHGLRTAMEMDDAMAVGAVLLATALLVAFGHALRRAFVRRVAARRVVRSGD